MSDLSVYHLLWYFAVYSFLGWCLEVCFCSINTGKFVNRGFLNGPLCPIYGFGMVVTMCTKAATAGWMTRITATMQSPHARLNLRQMYPPRLNGWSE